MRVTKTTFEVKENGVLVYQLNEYGHQRMFLSNEVLVEMTSKAKPADDPDPAYADYEQAKRQWSEGWRDEK